MASATPALVIDAFPPWWPFLVASYARSFPTYELVVVHTGPAPADAGASHVSYEATTVAALAARFASKLGAPPEVVRRKFASAKGLSDLKPFYGKVFEELLQGGCTHWGWVDWDVLAGDLRAAIPQAQLWEYDAVTLPGATLGFAWAGQLSVFQNTAELRELYRVVGDHVALGFKCCATEGNKEAGQSGWEERVFLRDVLRTKPRLRVAYGLQFKGFVWLHDVEKEARRATFYARAPLSRTHVFALTRRTSSLSASLAAPPARRPCPPGGDAESGPRAFLCLFFAGCSAQRILIARLGGY